MPLRTSGPIVIGGTKCPSITSKWITRAPASITSSIWAPSRPMSAERIDGATRGSLRRSRIRSLICREPRRLGGAQHRCTAALAFHVSGVGHPGDRLVLAAVGALGDEFEAAEAVDAAQAAGQLGRAQPGLAAVRAGGSAERVRLRRARLVGVAHRLIIAPQAGDEEAGGA